MLTVTSDDPYLSESVDMRMVEHSENVLILTAISHETGIIYDSIISLFVSDSYAMVCVCTAKPLIVETVTVVDNLRRLRTVQVCFGYLINVLPSDFIPSCFVWMSGYTEV